MMNLVQLGALKQVAVYDDGEVSKNTSEQLVRLSRRGRAWLALQARLKAERSL